MLNETTGRVNPRPTFKKGSNMDIKIKRLSETAKLPTRGDPGAAGLDLYADLHDNDCEICEIPAGTTKFIPTGFAYEIPEGFFGAVYARSGLACKQGLRPANCVGVIDSTYRGEVMVALHNDSGETRVVNQGDRIAQLVIQPFLNVDLIESEELSETERGAGGFGSTGQ